MCVCVHVTISVSVGPVCEVSSDWQCRVDPVVWVFDHGGPHSDLLFCGVHPADGLPITLTCHQKAHNYSHIEGIMLFLMRS